MIAMIATQELGDAGLLTPSFQAVLFVFCFKGHLDHLRGSPRGVLFFAILLNPEVGTG
jgi:hypothetical protein